MEKDINIENQNKKVSLKIPGENTNGEANDFSGGPEDITMVNTADEQYGEFLSRLEEPELRKQLSDKNIYELTIKNVGGMVMPVSISWTYKDGSTEIDRLPAEVWRLNEQVIKKTFVKEKEVIQVTLDPNFEFADIDAENNTFPRSEAPSEFDQIKSNN